MTHFHPENAREHDLGNRGYDVPDYCVHCHQPFLAHNNSVCPTDDRRRLGENYEQALFDRATKDWERMTPAMIRRHLSEWEKMFRLLPSGDKVRAQKMNMIRIRSSLDKLPRKPEGGGREREG